MCLAMRCTPVVDFLQMLPDTGQHLFPLGITEFSTKEFESEVHHVVVVDLFRRDVIAEFKPDSVQEINFLGCEMGSVRPQIKNLFLTGGRVHHECQLRLGIGQPLPGKPSDTRFFRW